MYERKIIGLGSIVKYSKKNIDLIYKYTSKDNKRIINGVKYVTFLSDEAGTVLAPIENLPEMTFKAKLRQAKFRSKK